MHRESIEMIFKNELGLKPVSVLRMQTGLCHYVYKVTCDKEYIIRINEDSSLLSSGLYWLNLLSEKDPSLPFPRILAFGEIEAVYYVIQGFLEGNDLGNVYDKLTLMQKKSLAMDMVHINRRIQFLNLDSIGYGYLKSLDDPDHKESWLEVLWEHLNRSRSRLVESECFPVSLIDKVESLIDENSYLFVSIGKIPFLDDATTKNVLIHKGKINGIVDVDEICFGDPLYQLALTKVSLIFNYDDTVYTDEWERILDLNKKEKSRLSIYVLNFMLDLMSEYGFKFNKDQRMMLSMEEMTRINGIFDEYYSKALDFL